MLEHDELDSLLNGINWDQPLSPLDLDLPTDPDIITLLSSSSPISPVAVPNQPPNPLIDKFLQSLTNAPIQFTDYPATPQQESRVNILLPSLGGSKAQPTTTQPEESQSNPLCQDNSALIQQLWEQQPKTLEHLFHDLVGFSESSIFSTNRRKRGFSGIANLLKDLDITLIYTTNYLTHFLLGKLCFGIKQDRSILFKTQPYHRRGL